MPTGEQLPEANKRRWAASVGGAGNGGASGGCWHANRNVEAPIVALRHDAAIHAAPTGMEKVGHCLPCSAPPTDLLFLQPLNVLWATPERSEMASAAASRVVCSEDHTPEGFRWLRLKQITVRD